MIKWLVLLYVVQAIAAYPGMRTQEEVEEFRDFLQTSKQGSGKTLEESMAQYPKANAWENSGRYQGDIVLFDEEIDQMVSDFSSNVTDGPSRTAVIPGNRRWPGNTIIYEIAPGHFNYGQRNMIIQGLNFFHETTCTRWVQRTNQRDYVRITNYQDGCYAHVGYYQNFGSHILNLANGCFNLMIVIHEMLHSAGFNHMHQTYNRYDWIWINWDNVGGGARSQFYRMTNYEVTMLGLPYEYASNQHYDQWAFSWNGQPTISARFDTGGQMGQLTHITGFDILRLARLYNCPGAWSVEVSAEDINKPYSEEFGRKMKEAAEKEAAQKVIVVKEDN